MQRTLSGRPCRTRTRPSRSSSNRSTSSLRLRRKHTTRLCGSALDRREIRFASLFHGTRRSWSLMNLTHAQLDSGCSRRGRQRRGRFWRLSLPHDRRPRFISRLSFPAFLPLFRHVRRLVRRLIRCNLTLNADDPNTHEADGHALLRPDRARRTDRLARRVPRLRRCARLWSSWRSALLSLLSALSPSYAVH